MPETLLPTPHVTAISLEIVDRCNFSCDHCLQGKPAALHDMTPAEAETIVSHVASSHLNHITLFGGEPRIHPQLDKVLTSIRDALVAHGLYPRTEDPSENKAFYEGAVNERNKFLATFTDEGKDELTRSGEMQIMISNYLDQHSLYQTPVGIEVFTNGFGMKDQTSTAQILRHLHALNVDQIAVSVDEPHRRFVADHHIHLDYKALFSFNDPKTRTLFHIPDDISISSGSIGSFILPIGRATNFTWDQRTDCVNSVKRALAYEFNNWATVSTFAHSCYCGPAKFHRSIETIKKYQPENQINNISFNIDPQGNVRACILPTMPSAGNLLQQSSQDIYHTLATNRLGIAIATEGPQGLARRLTNRSEAEIQEQFIECTPCGLCQDLVARYPSDFQAMMNQRS